jgi:very-short-patch-repair endonuclease
MSPKQKLQSVLEYTEKLLSLGERIVFDVTATSIAVFSEHELTGQEGVTVNPAGADSWIQLQRTRESKPPALPDGLNGWVQEEARPSPDRQPKLIAERCLRLSQAEISELTTIGALLPDDIMHPLKPDPDGKLDAVLRIANLPNLLTEWNQYIEGPWSEWAARERPRRRSINLYNRLYQIHQRMVSYGEDNPIEVVFGCGIALWNTAEQKIIVPIIEQLMESNLDESGTISLNPRNVNPIVNLKSFHALDIEGSEAVQREATSLLTRIVEDPDTDFSPFNPATFEKILRTCAAKLSSTGTYLDELASDKTLPPPTSELVVAESWLIFARQRNEDVRKDDIRRLMTQVEKIDSEGDLPPAAKKFVEPPSDKRIYDTGFDLGNTTLELPDGPKSNPRWSPRDGQSTRSTPDAAGTEKKTNFFFPLPFNEDQVAIAQALIDADGVVVQGPPGTGKTHTIANIICHYLATGRRVLVTAKTPEALTALQEKLPEGIRHLAIAIIHNDREGSRQLETAMQLISDEIKQIRPHQVEQDLKDKQNRIAAVRIRISEIESILLDVAKSNLSEVVFNGANTTPMKLAQLVADAKPVHAWFPDKLTPILNQKPDFDATHIDNARALRSALGVDLQYPTHAIQAVQDFPSLQKIVDAHEQLQNYKAKQRALQTGDLPIMSTDHESALDEARNLKEYLEGLRNFYETASKSNWMQALTDVLSDHYNNANGAPPELLLLLKQWTNLADRGAAILEEKSANVTSEITNREVDDAIDELCAGKNPFGLLSFGKNPVRDLVRSMQIGGDQPKARNDWLAIKYCRSWYKDVNSYLSLWERSSQTFGLPRHAQDLLTGAKVIVNAKDLIEQTIKFILNIPVRKRQAAVLFPYGIKLDVGFTSEAIVTLLEALEANIARQDVTAAVETQNALAAMSRDASLPFDRSVRDFAEAIGDIGVAQHQIAKGWQTLSAELSRLSHLRNKMEILDEISNAVKRSGAPLWATMLRLQQEAEASASPTPATWEDTWNWAKADAFISSITNPERLRLLIAEQSELENEQKRLFTEVVRLRTFLGLKMTITDRVQAALSKFSAAIGKLGGGTGKSASRYRRIIRSSTMEAAHAIPCWILPEWRVSEQLPSELAMFDLVVVDEASQSDITALPTILRGKKALIVGDDKQVSPSTIGIEERQIIQLRTTFLAGIPNADQMDPGSSLYELASAVFPGKAIMLREHFRCVEPIIRFSSQFYSLPLVPLRLPTASERLTPPLIDIFVANGVKLRDTNQAEAEVIVNEIGKIAKDASMVGRTIGVISLIGEKQAKLIYDLIIRELGTEVIDRHRIMCGNAAAFQGQERNIVFLSMVECRSTATAKTTRIFSQRFNVAMSRARDRVYLVRSVSSSDLKSNDLKLRVIEHFRSPMEKGNVGQSTDLLQLCESDFERDVANRLIKSGYRVKPQVPIAGYRLDLVVEGMGDRRLAIELDGDKYHGPDRWAADVQRQKSLERLGWKFWRCWGSHWLSDKEGCYADLIKTLNNMNIDPIGAEAVEDVWTEHRTVGHDLGVEQADANPATINMQMPKLAEEVVATKPAGLGVIKTYFAEGDEPIKPDDARIGDLIVVRFNDNNKVLRVRLSKKENHPASGVVHFMQPLGKALLGSSVDDEVDIDIGGVARRATVERIERGVH